MSTPLVSICLPNLNTLPFLPERMDTLLAQTVRDWELIICDGYSNDGAWEFFQKFKGDPRIHMAQLPRGQFQAWNWCMDQAKGEYIYIATSDDTASPTLLEKLIEPLQRIPEVAMVMCDYQHIDEKGRFIEVALDSKKRHFYGSWMEQPCLRNGTTEFLIAACFGCPMWVTMTAVLFRKTLLQRAGLFRTDCGSMADFQWALRVLLATDVAFVPGRLATWRIHPTQSSAAWRPGLNEKRLVDFLRGVLEDPRSSFPERWKQIDRWEKRILFVLESNYFESFGLFRGELKRDLRRFARGALASMREEPGYFFAQALRGFPWPDESRSDPAVAARELIQIFGCPWPPRSLSLS